MVYNCFTNRARPIDLALLTIIIQESPVKTTAAALTPFSHICTTAFIILAVFLSNTITCFSLHSLQFFFLVRMSGEFALLVWVLVPTTVAHCWFHHFLCVFAAFFLFFLPFFGFGLRCDATSDGSLTTLLVRQLKVVACTGAEIQVGYFAVHKTESVIATNIFESDLYYRVCQVSFLSASITLSSDLRAKTITFDNKFFPHMSSIPNLSHALRLLPAPLIALSDQEHFELFAFASGKIWNERSCFNYSSGHDMSKNENKTFDLSPSKTKTFLHVLTRVTVGFSSNAEICRCASRRGISIDLLKTIDHQPKHNRPSWTGIQLRVWMQWWIGLAV